jgi:predicted dinucleotide-binding enzyme
MTVVRDGRAGAGRRWDRRRGTPGAGDGTDGAACRPPRRHREQPRPDSLVGVVSELGDRVEAGTVPDVSSARIVVLAVPWPRVPATVRGLEWNGQIVIDATNDFDGTDLDGTTSSELIAALVPGARLVKAANTLRAEMLASDPNETGGRRVMIVSGDDGEARMQVATLFEDAGFSAIDLGGLATGGALQQVGGALSGANLIRLPAKN